METIIETIPGQRVCEYLLVLAPHEELWNRIMKLKEDFATRYQTEHARWGKPHITLVNFLQYEKNEAGVIGTLKSIAIGLAPFKIELKNFGSYPKDIIFVNVDSKLPVQNLVNEIRSECDQMMHLNDEIKPYFLDDPNINIARKLTPAQYEKARKEYSKARFTGRFIADAMGLLKRSVDEMKYHLAQKFEFENLPVVTKEGKLV